MSEICIKKELEYSLGLFRIGAVVLNEEETWNENVKVILLTKNVSKQLELDVQKINAQYKNFEIRKFEKSHDRFLIIDNTEIYHLGASLKDLGKKWFAFSKLGSDFVEKILGRL